jgi:hypothetical protein
VNLVRALVGLMGLSLLAAACGGSPGGNLSSGAASTRSTQLAAALAFSRCMRSHGVSSFPDPDSQGQFPPFQTGVSKQISAAANDACRHLLSNGGGGGTPQDRREKLAFALNVARCLRTHGYPSFPDPTVSSGGTSQSLPPGVDPNSPQFRSAQTVCEKQARGGR